MKKHLFSTIAVTALAITCLTGCGVVSSSSDGTSSEGGSTGGSSSDPSTSSVVDNYDYSNEGVVVQQIDGLSDDYIMGVDLSSIIEVENAGGVFYNEEGEQEDIFTVLADSGVNYIRIRLWNDPYDEDGNSFGGGGNDIETDLKIAKRAVDAGMKVCLDFHYSDFWADPDKQTMPREWEDQVSSYSGVSQIVYDYTYDVLTQFKDAGCLPSMVQTGNEINNGFIWDWGKAATWRNIYLSYAMQAVKAVDENIKTVIHLANGATYSSISSFITQLDNGNVDFDVIGLSYYSYWHGSMSQFQSCVEQLNANFDHEICVMEYSYGYGDNSNDYTSNIFSSSMEETGGYKATVQGQASYIHDVNEVIASVDKGIGSFYWEPAWLPLAGTSWATEYAHDYLVEQGDGGGEGTCSWANQALFDFDGNPLDSLKAFRLMRDSGTAEEEILEIESNISASVNLSKVAIEDIIDNLPTTTTALTDWDRWVDVDITYNEEDLAQIDGEGTYTIHGTATKGSASADITATITCYYDFLENGGFEDDGVTSDVKDFSQITGWDMDGTSGSYRVESKNARSGSANLNIWCSSAFENELSQQTTVPAGTYEFAGWTRSSSPMPESTLYASAGDTDLATAVMSFGASWSDWVQTSITFTVTETTDITVGVRSTGEAEAWAHFDDFTLAEVK